MDINKNIQPLIAWPLIGGIGIMVLLAMFLQFDQSNKLARQLSIAPANYLAKETLVMIDYGDGKIRKFKGPVLEKTRAWDLFQQAVAIGGINVEITDGFIPQEIGGFKNEKGGKQWHLYVNNAKQKFSPFEIHVSPGDEITFKYE